MAHGSCIDSTLGVFMGFHRKRAMPRAIKGGKETAMKSGKPNTIHATEFSCQTPLKFYEHCASCSRFVGCPDLALVKEILRTNKNVNYNRDTYSARGELEGGRHRVDANVFTCLSPLCFFEKTRKRCPHEGRCREEGLLLVLLTEKKTLDYSQKALIKLPRSKPRLKPRLCGRHLLHNLSLTHNAFPSILIVMFWFAQGLLVNIVNIGLRVLA